MKSDTFLLGICSIWFDVYLFSCLFSFNQTALCILSIFAHYSRNLKIMDENENSSKESAKVVLYYSLPLRKLASTVVSLPLTALVVCFISAVLFQFDDVHETHCKVRSESQLKSCSSFFLYYRKKDIIKLYICSKEKNSSYKTMLFTSRYTTLYLPLVQSLGSVLNDISGVHSLLYTWHHVTSLLLFTMPRCPLY